MDLGLAGWCHGTKRGRGPRWLTLLLITYLNLTVLIVTSSLCPPSPARRPFTARGGLCYSKPHSSRLATWYETGSGGGCLVLLIIGPTLHYWWHLHIVTSPQGQEKPHLGRRSALCSNNSKVRLMFIVYISNMFQQNIRSCK